jgi:Pyruvate/2-oxoacid:ferredoxin oxidoreductase gamma subunit
MLGALIEKLQVLTLAHIKAALDAHMPERHRKFFSSNVKALDNGAAFVRGELTIQKIASPTEESLETIAPTSV